MVVVVLGKCCRVVDNDDGGVVGVGSIMINHYGRRYCCRRGGMCNLDQFDRN